MLVFLTFQAADGLLTYGVASLFGAGVEGNPLIATGMQIVGVGPALFVAKIASAAGGILLYVRGVQVGRHRVLRCKSAAIPNAIAALLLYVQKTTDKIPHAYFGWTEGNPIKYLARFILFGEGDIAPVTHEVLRKAEPDRERRPAIHVG